MTLDRSRRAVARGSFTKFKIRFVGSPCQEVLLQGVLVRTVCSSSNTELLWSETRSGHSLTAGRRERTIEYLPSLERPAFGKHSPRLGEVPCGQCGIHTSDLGPLSWLIHKTSTDTYLLIMLFLPRGLGDRCVL